MTEEAMGTAGFDTLGTTEPAAEPGAYVTNPQPGPQQQSEPQQQQTQEQPTDSQQQEYSEDYSKLVIPEGYEEDPAVMGEAREIFKSMKLTSEQAQALVDFVAKNGGLGGMVDEEQLWKRQVDDWTNKIKADSEVGGARLSESLSLARKAVDKLGGKELMNALDQTGAGVHPVIFKGFVKLGKMFSEDRFVNPPAAPKSAGLGTPHEQAALVYGKVM